MVISDGQSLPWEACSNHTLEELRVFGIYSQVLCTYWVIALLWFGCDFSSPTLILRFALQCNSVEKLSGLYKVIRTLKRIGAFLLVVNSQSHMTELVTMKPTYYRTSRHLLLCVCLSGSLCISVSVSLSVLFFLSSIIWCSFAVWSSPEAQQMPAPYSKVNLFSLWYTHPQLFFKEIKWTKTSSSYTFHDILRSTSLPDHNVRRERNCFI